MRLHAIRLFAVAVPLLAACPGPLPMSLDDFGPPTPRTDASTTVDAAKAVDAATTAVDAIVADEASPPSDLQAPADAAAAADATLSLDAALPPDSANGEDAAATSDLGACATVICTALDQCHVVGVCDVATGACSNPAKLDGTACNDGNACTQVDTCQSGTCVGQSPVSCTASDQCHSAGTCDPISGCSNPVQATGTACTLPNASGSCAGGGCQIASCASGYHDCDGVGANGCETFGACPVACTPVGCGPGYVWSTTACACVLCMLACPPGYQLDSVACACVPATPQCPPTCPPGTACNVATGNCDPIPCAPNQSMCGGICVTTASDPSNCGGCARACAPSQTCSGGQCTCPASPVSGLPEQLCSGVCVDTANDPNNCGSCGVVCLGSGEGAGDACVFGAHCGCLNSGQCSGAPPPGAQGYLCDPNTNTCNACGGTGLPDCGTGV
jgi:hypothetical protein